MRVISRNIHGQPSSYPGLVQYTPKSRLQLVVVKMSSSSTVSVAPTDSLTARDAKSALGLLTTRLSDVYQTYDIAVGYHAATKTWKIFVRMTTPVQPERQDEYKPATEKCSLEVKLASEDPVLFEPDAESVDFDAELAALEQVTQIAMYKGTPFLLQCNGDAQEHDCLALEAVLRIDSRGLDGVIERSKNWLWVPSF